MNNKINKIAAIYIRVSTTYQEEGNSLEKQKERCLQEAKEKGYEISEIYTDVESGSKDDRSGFLQMLTDMKLHKFHVLIVTEFSRISRKTRTLLEFLEQFQNNGVDLISITQSIDTTTPVGKLMFSLTGVLAEFERDQTRVRVKHTLTSMAKSGKFTGGVVPYGYTLKDKKLIINPEEAENIKKAYSLFIKGYSKRSIGLTLGIPSTSLQRMLTTPFYTGKKVYNKRATTPNGKLRVTNENEWLISDGEHEAIIDKDTFKLASSMNIKKPLKESSYILTGLLKCYHGHSIHGKKGGPNRYYLCSNKECCKKFIESESLEQSILDQIINFNSSKIITDISYLERIKEENINKIKELQMEKNDLTSQSKMLLNLTLNGTITEEEFKLKREELSQLSTSIDNEINSLNKDNESMKVEVENQELFEQLSEKLKNTSNKKEIKNILQIIIKEIRFINDFEYNITFNI
ncbi:recombinase family protein [Cetobacterium sp.]|uniref:recombinase family protein n=1 Tax=Cetobacterium sp. TaxID=2071632 RepID=UPI003F37511A